MKTPHIIVIIVVVLFLAVLAFAWSGKKGEVVNTLFVVEESRSVLGCYIAGTPKDVYTLHIQSQEGEYASGTLVFKNFEKDSSSGTFIGTYKSGILLGDYAFQSEGLDSVIQVIFKKSGENFVRGYGEVNAEGNRFIDLNNITYDSSSSLSVFKKMDCARKQSL